MQGRRPRERVLIVDGYNVLNAWRSNLNSADTLADARDELARRLQDYAGFSGQKVILVMDAWLSDRTQRTEEVNGPLTIVFTRKGELADHYIERLCDEYAHRVELGLMELRVATSDGVEQMVVMGRGAVRMSARELLMEMDQVRKQGREGAQPVARKRNSVMEQLPEDVQRRLGEIIQTAREEDRQAPARRGKRGPGKAPGRPEEKGRKR